jgi:hypothetical protein
MEIDQRTGFIKRPTFTDLAQLERKRYRTKPIIRDAATFWSSFESSWLKGPIDEVANRGFLTQQRRAIQQAANNQSRKTDQPVAHIMGNIDRAFQKPLKLESETIETWKGGMPGYYANPAPQTDAFQPHDAAAQAEMLRRFTEAIEKLERMNRNTADMSNATHSGASRAEYVRSFMRDNIRTARDATGIPIPDHIVEGVSVTSGGLASLFGYLFDGGVNLTSETINALGSALGLQAEGLERGFEALLNESTMLGSFPLPRNIRATATAEEPEEEY